MSEHGDIIFTSTNAVTDATVTFRIQAMLPLCLNLPYCATDGEVTAVTMFEVNSLCQKVRSKSAYFWIHNTSLLMHHVDELNKSKKLDDKQTVAVIRKSLQDDSQKKRSMDLFHDFIPVSYYQRMTELIEDSRTSTCSPIIRCDIDVFRCVTIELPVDVLCVVDGKTSTSKLARIFSDALCDQIRAMQHAIINYRQQNTFDTPEPFHFKPPGLDHFVTVVYPHNASLPDTVEQRCKIHDALNIAPNRPLFRPSAAHRLDSVSPEGYLISPHRRINPQHMKGKRVSVVRGDYTYHHYMQDHFDDNMWGCAYRSLQTLVSWFRLQGYTDAAVPSHRDIQRALVDVGDKPPSFVDSRKWIGSFEVGMCLEKLIGVQSKFISVNRGDELITKGRELAVHFETHGSPVMIGGGVLAHTILGVDFNEDTGDTRFLILDPHYTGDEDIRTIIDKGWCGWKAGNFWDKNAMYNMCLPLTVECV